MLKRTVGLSGDTTGELGSVPLHAKGALQRGL